MKPTAHLYLWPRLSRLRVPELTTEQVREGIESGKVTFLFDENGKFSQSIEIYVNVNRVKGIGKGVGRVPNASPHNGVLSRLEPVNRQAAAGAARGAEQAIMASTPPLSNPANFADKPAPLAAPRFRPVRPLHRAPFNAASKL